MSMARATKAELEIRVGEAADMLAQGHSATVATTHAAENINYLGVKLEELLLLHMN